MARPALATIADLEDRLGTIDSSDIPVLEARLADASAIVRAYAGQTWLNDAGTALADVPPDIPGIVATMVERAVRNPSGVTSEQAGPFGRSFGADAAQRLYLTKAERAVIRAAVGVSSVSPLATTRENLETPRVFDTGGTLPTEDTIPW